jgi:hypothetical protein
MNPFSRSGVRGGGFLFIVPPPQALGPFLK